MPKILPTKDPFSYGNCSAVAVAQAFNVDYFFIKEMFRKVGCYNCCKGCTTEQIGKVVRKLCRERGLSCKYIKPSKYITIKDFIKHRKQSNLIILTENHTTYYSHGILYDSWYYSSRRWLGSIPLTKYIESAFEITCKKKA